MTGPRTTPLLTPDRRSFAGFPSSGLGTVIPNLFFARVLPQITLPEELAVSVYFFYGQQQAPGPRRKPRFLTRRELAGDATLLRALASLSGRKDHPSGEGLSRGLEAALERGTLFRAEIEVDGRTEEALAVNTPANRRAMEALAGRRLWIEEPLPPAEGAAAPNIFALYEENIGTITPLIAEHLQDAEERYPADWVREAFSEAVSLNKRNWRYIASILRRWESEGPDYEKPERDTEAAWLARRYSSGKRRSRS